jgi:hypothetical protein
MNDKKFIKTKIRKSLHKSMGKEHLSAYEIVRLNQLSNLVSSILNRGDSRLNQLALANTDKKKFESKKKELKRTVQNKYLTHDSYFLPYIKPLLETLSAKGTLVFSIDGSVVGQGCMCLMFSVIYQGKAIPVIWKVYKAPKGHLSEDKHCELLAGLSALIPENCRVAITGDGEFDGCEWQKNIVDLGWIYVLRTSKNTLITEDEWDEFKLDSVCIEQGEHFFLEDIGFTKKKFTANIFIWHGKGHKKPLYLVTNLDYEKEIKAVYKKRFKIEPFFRDQKSKGFNIHKSGLSDPKRLERLLMGTCLAYIFAIMAATKAYKSVFYKEIAGDDKEVLSLFQLGYRFILHLVDLRQWRVFSWKLDFPLP